MCTTLKFHMLTQRSLIVLLVKLFSLHFFCRQVYLDVFVAWFDLDTFNLTKMKCSIPFYFQMLLRRSMSDP